MASRSAPLGNSPEARVLRGLLAALTATPFVYIPGLLYPSVVPRAVYFRFLVAAAVFLLTVLWAWGRWSPIMGEWRSSRLGMALAAFTAAAVVATVAGVSPIQGLLGGMIRMDGAIAWLGYLLFYLLLRLVLDKESWRSFLKLIALVAAAVAIWSLLQAYGESFGVALVGWKANRVVGTIGLEGPLAIYMLLGAAVTGFLATGAKETWARLAWAALAVLDLWIVALTGTRSVLVAAAVSLAAVGGGSLLFTRRGTPGRQLVLRALGGLAAAVVGLVLLGDFAFPAVGRMVDIGSDALSSRLHLWRSAWKGFLEQPLLGAGLESFDLIYDEHFRAQDYLASGATHHNRVHNVILGAMAETGLVGLTAYLSFWALALRTALSALRISDRDPGLVWLATAVGAYFVYLQLWFEDLGSFHVLLVILAFLEHRRLEWEAAGRGGNKSKAVASRGQPKADVSETTSAWMGGRPDGTDTMGSRKRWLCVGAVGVILAGLGWYHIQVVGAARETRRALSARSTLGPFQHFTRALEYRTATTREITSRYVAFLDGFAGMIERGQIAPNSDSVASLFRRARRAVEQEVDQRPDYSLVHARLASLYRARWRWSNSSDDFEASKRALHRALDVSPERIRYLHQLARLDMQNGDHDRAMDLLDRALDRLPGWWETYDTMAQVQWDAGNRERAVELLLRAARTDVRYQTAGTGTQFMVRAGSWLEARGTPMQAVELFEAYLGTRYPGWDEPGGPTGTEVPAAALPIAARLPITLMHAGRIGEAGRAARRLRERLPPHLRRPAVTDRLNRFVADMEAGRVDRWRDAWGVLPTDVPLGG